MSNLPLRLAVEPFFKNLLGSCFVLPSKEESKICFVVNDKGIVCLVYDDIQSNSLVEPLLGYNKSFLSSYILVFSSGSSSSEGTYWLKDGVRYNKTPDRIELNSCIFSPSVEIAQIIVDGIERYYGRQVLEPSIRGFLSILEKQFPRNDLYLFELLQNSVDDGASHVKFKEISNGKDSKNPSFLLFTHNGRGFTPLDVLGLASVGLSTKGSEGNSRRTIGFMGVGFKAVYKRFRRVVIYDDTWRFMFEEPSRVGKQIERTATATAVHTAAAVVASVEPEHAWVMKPKWVTNPIGVTCDSDAGSATKSWCHFQLELPRKPSNSSTCQLLNKPHQQHGSSSNNSSSSITEDLKSLPETIAPLLGRQAISSKLLLNQQTDVSGSVDWTLEWGDQKFMVNISSNFPLERLVGSKSAGGGGGGDGGGSGGGGGAARVVWSSRSELVEVYTEDINRPGGTSKRFWQFLFVGFVPDAAAQDAYLSHTKKIWKQTTTSGATQLEETAFFFEVDSSGHPVNKLLYTHTGREVSGKVHAILPTKLRIPCPVSWQASWLLSVDRQEVQNIFDNDWNKCMVSQASKLIVAVLRWIAFSNPKDLYSPYSLLPMIESDPSGSLHTNLLGAKVAIKEVQTALQEECLVPVASHLSESSGGTFNISKNVCWLPEAFQSRLPVGMLKAWFGLDIFDSARVKEFSWSSLWRQTLAFPSDALLRSRSAYFRLKPYASDTERVSVAVDILTVIGECISTTIESQASTKSTVSLHGTGKEGSSMGDNTTKNESQGLCSGWLPPLSSWPVFLSEKSNSSIKSNQTPIAAVQGGEEYTADRLCFGNQIAFPARDFAYLPVEIRTLLRPAILSVAKQKNCEKDNRNQYHKRNYSNENNAAQDLSLFNSDLESIVLQCIKNQSPLTSNKPFSDRGDSGNKNKDRQRLNNSSSKKSNYDYSTTRANSSSLSTGVASSDVLAIQSILDSKGCENEICICYAAIESSFPKQIVTVKEAVKELFLSWTSIGDLSDALSSNVASELQRVIDTATLLFRWALKANNPSVISHVLTNSFTSSSKRVLRLTPVDAAYLGHLYGGAEAQSIEELDELLPRQTTANNSSTANKSRDSSLSTNFHFVSSLYLLEDTDLKVNLAYGKFLSLCGVHSTISIEASARVATTAELSALADGPPRLRTTTPSINIQLPYGLGTLSRKQCIIVDAQFSPEWLRVLKTCSQSNVQLAKHFSVALSVFLQHIECAQPTTAEAVPCAASCLKGVLDSDNENDEFRPLATSQKRILNQSQPYPGLSRCYYLPPGQPGASAVSVGTAQWVRALCSAPWVPAVPPGASACDIPTLALRPCEVLLPKIGGTVGVGVGVGVGVTSGDIPVARLSDSFLRILSGLPADLQREFAWGTVKPRPPIERFQQLIKSISDSVLSKLPSTVAPKDNTANSAIVQSLFLECDVSLYIELVSLWRIFGTAYREKRMSSKDIDSLVSACIASGSMPIPGPIPGSVYPLNRCLDMKRESELGDQKRRTIEEEDMTLAARAFCRCGFLLDLSGTFNHSQSSRNSRDTENNRNNNNEEEEISFNNHKKFDFEGICSDFINILKVPHIPSTKSAEEFLFICSTCQPANPSSDLRKAYSFSLWIITRTLGELSKTNSRQLTSSSAAAASNLLKSKLPYLNIFCTSGPGSGPYSFPASWLPVWADHNSHDTVSPLLIDDRHSSDKSYGVSKSALLQRKHNFQPLGMLDHINFEDYTSTEYSVLREVESQLVDALNLPRLSDSTKFSLQPKIKGKGELLPEVSDRLEALILLLRCLEQNLRQKTTLSKSSIASAAVDAAAAVDDDHLTAAPVLIKYTELVLHFKTMKMDSPEVKPVYAIWGSSSMLQNVLSKIEGSSDAKKSSNRSEGINTINSESVNVNFPSNDMISKYSKKKCIIVAFNVTDYVADLEEILVSYVFGSNKVSTMDRNVARALKLLNHLENGRDFIKLMKRDFSTFFESNQVVQDSAITEGVDSNLSTKDSGNFAYLQQKLQNSINSLIKENESKVRLKEEEEARAREIKIKIENDKKKQLNELSINKRSRNLYEIENTEIEGSQNNEQERKRRTIESVFAAISSNMEKDLSSFSEVQRFRAEEAAGIFLASLDMADFTAPTTVATTTVGGQDEIGLLARGGGRGRGGLSLLPAWMTSSSSSSSSSVVERDSSVNLGGVISSLELPESSRYEASEADKDSSGTSSKVHSGFGLKILQKMGYSEEEESGLGAQGQGIKEPIAGEPYGKKKQGLGFPSFETEKNAPPVPGTGRGRGGISLLPAWMEQRDPSACTNSAIEVSVEGEVPSIRTTSSLDKGDCVDSVNLDFTSVSKFNSQDSKVSAVLGRAVKYKAVSLQSKLIEVFTLLFKVTQLCPEKDTSQIVLSISGIVSSSCSSKQEEDRLVAELANTVETVKRDYCFKV